VSRRLAARWRATRSCLALRPLIGETGAHVAWRRPRAGRTDEDVLHETAGGAVATTDFGTREFATVDLDGNLLTFFKWDQDS